KVQNFERFLVVHQEWRDPLDEKAVAALDDAERERLTSELIAELLSFTQGDRQTYDRLMVLKQRTDEASAAAYRMEVRLGVVLRMRALLDEVAGRVYLADEATPQERDTYAALRACEDVNFVAAPPEQSAAAMPPPERFPPLEDDRQMVQDVMPAWMGIQFRPIAESPHKNEKLPPGAVTVMTVFPGSAAATAGLEVGDIILGPPEHPFQEPQQVREWTMRSEINEPAPLVI